SCTGQYYLDYKEDRRHKKERKLQRLSDSCKHTGQSRREKKTSRLFFLLWFRTAVHGKCRSRKTEDHENKLSGEVSGSICTKMYSTWICQLSKENILSSLYQLSCHFHSSSHGCLPERKIKYVMESKWN